MNDLNRQWMQYCASSKYTYNFSWMGMKIIQMPQDMVAVQEIIHRVRPDVIIETGVAHGGSLIFYASLMKLLDIPGKIIGVEIDLRSENRANIDSHPLAEYISIVDGSSTDESVLEAIKDQIPMDSTVLVILDSDHVHDHVLRELELYSPLVSPGSYVVVMDTIVEFMSDDTYPNRDWNSTDNPGTAVKKWLEMPESSGFEIDSEIDAKLGLTMAPGGYLRRTH